MSEALICTTTGLRCENATFCVPIVEPLQGAIPEIRRRAGGVSWNLAKTALTRDLNPRAGELCVDFNPQIDAGGNALICPKDVLEGDLGSKIGVQNATDALRNIAARSVSDVASDLANRRSR